ncbi:MAG TPA: hypothetical protein DEB40_03810 [Elusimicrobia bacterium]|nr:hypothetical protein [Elusimicrobiota bacterium]HBT60853.1 hypothetical protein [Elusimicrobiota bacterium]
MTLKKLAASLLAAIFLLMGPGLPTLQASAQTVVSRYKSAGINPGGTGKVLALPVQSLNSASSLRLSPVTGIGTLTAPLKFSAVSVTDIKNTISPSASAAETPAQASLAMPSARISAQDSQVQAVPEAAAKIRALKDNPALKIIESRERGVTLQDRSDALENLFVASARKNDASDGATPGFESQAPSSLPKASAESKPAHESSPAVAEMSGKARAGERSSWFDRFFKKADRRSAAAYGAIKGFWADLAAQRLTPDQAREALRVLASDKYDDAVRQGDVPSTLLSLRFPLNEDGFLPLDSIADQLHSLTGMRRVSQTSVYVNKEHHFDMDYSRDGGFRGSRSYDTRGKTFVYSAEVYQAPGAGADAPALLRLKFFNPGNNWLGDSLRATSFSGLSSSEGIYLVKNLSSLGKAGSLPEDSEEVMSGRAVGKILASLVQALDAAKSPVFQNYTIGYGAAATGRYVEVSDPASGAQAGSRTYLHLEKQVAILGTYMVRSILPAGGTTSVSTGKHDLDWLESLSVSQAFNYSLPVGIMLVSGLMVSAGCFAGLLMPFGIAALMPVTAAFGIAAALSALFGLVAGGRSQGMKFSPVAAGLGALSGGLLAAGIKYFVVGSIPAALLAMGVGGVVWVFTEALREMSGGASLMDGLNSFQGKDYGAKFKAARKSFLKIAFRIGDYYYESRGIEHWYGKAGMRPGDVALLRQGMEDTQTDMFNTLVLLLKAIPGKPGEPGIAVIRGGSQLRATIVGERELTMPTGETIPYEDILASVGYAKR